MRFIVWAWVLAGCHKTSDVRETADTGEPPADTVETGESSVVAAATEGVFHADFSVDASGEGSDLLGSIGVEDDVGDLVLDGVAHHGFAYTHQAWVGYVLVDLLTLSADGTDLGVTYLYGQDGVFLGGYTESYDVPMTWDPGAGTVSEVGPATDVPVSLPALLALPPPTDVGLTISGDAVQLDGVEGSLVAGGKTWTLLPFGTVDCTDCPDGPWYEIHSLLAGEDEACFGILYLFPEDPTWVQLEYGICLPTLATLSETYTASWTGSLATRARPRGPVPAGRPPRWGSLSQRGIGVAGMPGEKRP